MFNPHSKTNKGGYKIQNKRLYSCICKNCNKNFEGTSSTKAFCSDICETQYRSQEHENQGKCLCCQKQLSLKQLKNKSKFCNNSCATKYNNFIRTPEEKERIREICRISQKNIMSDPDEIKKRKTKRKITISNWTDEKKENHKQILSKNAKIQFQKETLEEKKRRYSKIQDVYNKKSPEEKQKIIDKIQTIRKNWSDEKKDEVKKKAKDKRRMLLLATFDHIEDFNREFVNKVFISKDRFLFDQFREYFRISKSSAYIIKKDVFDINIPNKQNRSKIQDDLFNSICTENKIINDRSFIKPLELDIVLPDIKLAIEYDGLMYHSEGMSDSQIFNNVNSDRDYHLKKTNLVEEKGYQLFHIFESDDIEIWKSMINNKLGLNKKYMPGNV